jgi:hypothetical protein
MPSKISKADEQKFEERIVIGNGFVTVYDANNKEVSQLGFYRDGQYGLIFNDKKAYRGSEAIERHITVTEYGRQPRKWTPDDRKMRVDNTA